MGEWSYNSAVLGLSTQYPLDRRLGGPQRQSGPLAPAENKTPAFQTLPIPNEISRLLQYVYIYILQSICPPSSLVLCPAHVHETGLQQPFRVRYALCSELTAAFTPRQTGKY
jgi:hypothetical protein